MNMIFNKKKNHNDFFEIGNLKNILEKNEYFYRKK